MMHTFVQLYSKKKNGEYISVQTLSTQLTYMYIVYQKNVYEHFALSCQAIGDTQCRIKIKAIAVQSETFHYYFLKKSPLHCVLICCDGQLRF